MHKYKLSNDDFLVALAEQREFLRRACDHYDSGFTAAAKQISVILYALLFDGKGNTVSLFKNLKIFKDRSFLSSANQEMDQGNFLAANPLVFLSFQLDRVSYYPRCYLSSESPLDVRKIKFSEWWEEKIYKEPNKLGGSQYLSRKLVILLMRNKEGSHIDNEINHEGYAELRKGRGAGIFYADTDGIEKVVPNLIYATVRQIAWEVENSILDLSGGPILPPDGVTGLSVYALRSLYRSAKENVPSEQGLVIQMGAKVSETAKVYGFVDTKHYDSDRSQKSEVR